LRRRDDEEDDGLRSGESVALIGACVFELTLRTVRRLVITPKCHSGVEFGSEHVGVGDDEEPAHRRGQQQQLRTQHDCSITDHHE
jgi:hypothetical protein